MSLKSKKLFVYGWISTLVKYRQNQTKTCILQWSSWKAIYLQGSELLHNLAQWKYRKHVGYGIFAVTDDSVCRRSISTVCVTRWTAFSYAVTSTDKQNILLYCEVSIYACITVLWGKYICVYYCTVR